MLVAPYRLDTHIPFPPQRRIIKQIKDTVNIVR